MAYARGMELPPVASAGAGSGLVATGSAIRRQQARFDQDAQRTVADSLASSDAGSATSVSGQLTSDVVGLRTDSIVNSILYSVFRAQAEQQREAADLVKPRD